MGLRESSAYPSSEIVDRNSLCDLFAILSALSAKELAALRQRSLAFSVLDMFPSFGRRSSWSDDLKQLTMPQVLRAKMALKRLSQILQFAASIEVVDYDNTFFEFKDNYDPIGVCT